MDRLRLDAEIKETAMRLPSGPKLGVLGSASFWGSDSNDICALAGTHLASVRGLVLLTGGVPAVGETVGRAFASARKLQGCDPDVFHILPHGSSSWDYGSTLFAGDTMIDRREVLGRLAKLYVAIEGGPGTEHEASIVQSNGGVVVPVGRTGGFASELYAVSSCPKPLLQSEWRQLGDAGGAIEKVGVAVAKIVATLIQGNA